MANDYLKMVKLHLNKFFIIIFSDVTQSAYILKHPQHSHLVSLRSVGAETLTFIISNILSQFLHVGRKFRIARYRGQQQNRNPQSVLAKLLQLLLESTAWKKLLRIAIESEIKSFNFYQPNHAEKWIKIAHRLMKPDNVS
jgi:hypothetical protein